MPRRAHLAGEGDLALRGRVRSIEPLAGRGRSARWRVTVAVEEVLTGAFGGASFAFAVHSPVKSGLAVGGVYTVRAARTRGGWAVDEWQWLLGPAP